MRRTPEKETGARVGAATDTFGRGRRGLGPHGCELGFGRRVDQGPPNGRSDQSDSLAHIVLVRWEMLAAPSAALSLFAGRVP